MSLKSFFSGKKKVQESENFEPDNKNLHLRIEQALLKCKNDIKESQNEIDNIIKWSKEVISRIFFVPEKYWYVEPENYENIKLASENTEISKQVVSKCDEVIAGYKEQIEIRKNKIILSETLLKKYQESQNKLNETVKKIEKLKKEEQELQMLEIHSNRISKMNNENFSELSNAYNNTDSLKSMLSGIEDIENDFNSKNEYMKQFDLISQKYKKNEKSIDYTLYNEEIDRLLKKINA